MRKVLLIFVMGLTLQFAYSQENQKASSDVSWENIEVVYELESVVSSEQGTPLKETINTSLNFGTSSKFERACLKKLKQKAAKNGFTTLYIDQEQSKTKRYNKRGIEVTMVGLAYKG